MRIGDAAEHVGLESHVLRHWEDLGLLQPRRQASGHRDYSDSDLDQAQTIRRLQDAGLSLGAIRRLGGADRDRRRELVEAHRDELRGRIDRLQVAERFLAHALDCRHPVIADCDDCAAFARDTRHR